MWLVRARITRSRWLAGPAKAARDLFREKDAGRLSVYRVSDLAEACLVVALHEACGSHRPDKVDFLLFPFELPEAADVTVALEPDAAVLPVLSERHHVIQDLDSLEKCEQFAAAIVASTNFQLHRLKKSELMEAARDYCIANPQPRKYIKTAEWRQVLAQGLLP